MRHIEFFSKTRFYGPKAANHAGIAIHAIFSDRGFFLGSIKIQIDCFTKQMAVNIHRRSNVGMPDHL